jgi:hypothetical protein
VDSSLLDEWEKMRDPDYERRIAAERAKDAGADLRPPGAEETAADMTRDTKAFTAAIRNRIFTFLRGWAIGDFEAALASLGVETETRRDGDTATGREGESETRRTGEPTTGASIADSPIRPLADSQGHEWTADRLSLLKEEYLVDHQELLLTPEARNVRHTYIIPAEDQKTWRVQQMLVDPEGHNDWVAECEVDLSESKRLGEPALSLRRIGSLT